MKNTELLNASLGLVKQADLNEILKSVSEGYNKYVNPYLQKGLGYLGEGYDKYIDPYVQSGINTARPYLYQGLDLLNKYRPLNVEDSWKGGLAAAGVGGLLGLLRNKMRDDEAESDNRMSDVLTYAALMGLPVAAAPLISNRLGKFMADRTAKDLLEGKGGIDMAQKNPNFTLNNKQYAASDAMSPGGYAAARSAPPVREPNALERFFKQEPGSSTNDRGTGITRSDVENAYRSGDLQRQTQSNLQEAGLMNLLKMIRTIPKDTAADVDYLSNLKKDLDMTTIDQ